MTRAPSPPPSPIEVAAFYRFAPLADPAALAGALRALGAEAGLKGTIILAEEGVNGTVAGSPPGVVRMLDRLRALPGCADMPAKRHAAAAPPFARWKVKVKREIVTMGVPVDAAHGAGAPLGPAEWNALLADPELVLIDTRNAYEVALGTFPGALDPGTRSFGEFPAWFDRAAEGWRAQGRTPRLAMFCTGGIRCEKSTAYARARGFEVAHLRGGILDYLAAVEEGESRWRGDCFLFDERVAVTHGLEERGHAACGACGQPEASCACLRDCDPQD